MTIFSKIIRGNIPSYRIAENDQFYAFLDIFPFTKGHTLVIPKIETDKLFELPSQYLAGILPFAQPIAQAIQKAYPCNRVNILTLGFEVPHAHLHLIPMDGMQDVHLLNKKLRLTQEELAEVQQNILQYL
ncbi:MAG: HIT domain-containing protein [Hydrotalea flava]|uniref:HIT family protein n=1 Tax=Hydrotalea TaxID=1004300 RepID=UPI0016B4E5A8|nr:MULTISPECIES: HIT family protein [Hydrotalea]MBY0347516.1 HIT family protein [Hydrotalea flava]NIM35423.1 HIT domain-containing protein [Hydrotalea flava]NIM38281.1 HIT domain-containing protein [Hydrotalea flava]NIN03452.1 HIT domain-containing protein [Hydrotalea flava]NIN15139.1 HIT domain-containing protein [Hydrotalea flava]